ncbi:2-ketogluconate utilization repressor PtxS [Pseudomonas chlororaphis]|uniref:HTH-type transcriptional regulator PtxS n=1 Tax=Pseudomonas chlororaphis TaxID=587753 RepID=A0A3G7TS16_9PSED|nr:2-ketogluconate utilization repressor PtxS [Pseudomonas chlororaphis]
MPLALIALDGESALLFPETGFSDAAERRTWNGYAHNKNAKDRSPPVNSFSAAQRNRVTMLDVAERAGVSKASVSRFIGEDRALLSDAIALRIEQAIAELGYRPNQMARGLKRGRTRLIGMLVADIRNPYSIAVMHGVETACRQHGYSLVVCNTDRDDEQERQHLANLRSYNIEGLIVNTLGHHLDELRELHREMPMVLVDRKVEQLYSDLVGLDNPQAVRSAIEHLQERGYRDLLLVSEPHDGTSSRIERSNSFKAQIQQRPALQGAAVETGAALNQQLQAFLAAPGPGPKALFCANGVAALAATRALRELGCALFDEIGLIALDDLDWYPLVGSGITALAQPTERIGASAFECLLKRLRGDVEPLRVLDFPAELIVRGSTRQRGSL